MPETPGLDREFLCHNNKPAKQRLRLGDIYKGKIDDDTLEKNNDVLFDVDDFNKAMLESQGNTGTTNTLRNALASAGNAQPFRRSSKDSSDSRNEAGFKTAKNTFAELPTKI